MILDNFTKVAVAVLPRTQDTAYPGETSIDRGAPATGGPGTTDLGEGNPLQIIAQVAVNFTHGGAMTFLDIEAISGTGVDGNGKINAGVVSHGITRVPVAALISPAATASGMLAGPVIQGPTQRYVSVQFTPKGAAATAGEIRAWIVPRGHFQNNPASLA